MKIIRTGEESTNKLLAGAQKIGKLVGSTLGPHGRNVVIGRKFKSPIVTNDGVTVARFTVLEDETEDLGAQVLVEASMKTNEQAGDGPQPFTSKIYTPTGFVKMGDIKAGMDICGTNGTVQKVEGVFPKGKKVLHKVIFSDGRKVECCEDHLWTVITESGTIKTMPLKDFMNDLYRDKANEKIQYKYFVPNTFVDFVSRKEKQVLDPYLVGLLIGDGSLTGTGDIELSLGIKKQHILDKIKLPEGLRTVVSFVEERNYYRVKIKGVTAEGKTIENLLEDIGLYGVGSKGKHIPSMYLYSEKGDREALLQGLVDTDGYVNKRGLFEYSTVSPRLAHDYTDLMRSLGRQTVISIHTRERDGDSYSGTPIFRMYERMGYKYGLKIIDVETTDEVVEMQCIKVSNPDNLYITDDFVSTHNTTGTVVIGAQLVKDCFEKANEKIDITQTHGDMMSIFREIQETKKLVVEKIKERAKETTADDIKNIITTSLENKEYGEVIADMIEKVGKDGYVSVEENWATKYGITTEVVQGMKFLGTYATPYMMTNARKEAVWEDAPVLVLNHHIETLATFAELTQEMKKQGMRKLIILTEKYEKDVVQTFASYITGVNQMKSQGRPVDEFKILAIKAPTLTSPEFEDVATFLGARFFDKNAGGKVTKATMADLGFCKKIIVGEDTINILGGKGNDTALVAERIEKLKEQLETEKDIMFKEKLLRRIASLSSGVGIIRVGAMTEQEQEYWRYKIEDAYYAARAAQEEGYVRGGGLCLSEIADELGEGNILFHALKSTSKRIQDNAGGSFEIAENIIDPAKVIRMSVENACSAAGTLITCESSIAEEKPDIWKKLFREINQAMSKTEGDDFRQYGENRGKGSYSLND